MAIVKSTAMNFRVHASYQIHMFSRYMPRNEIMGLSMVALFLAF